VSRAKPLKTAFAIQAEDLAASMNATFQKMAIAPGYYVPELTVPEGPSTAGGKQALQRLRLVPRAPGYPILVVGSANQADRTAELRSYEHLDAIHRHRFKRPVALDRAGYEQFLEIARNFMTVLQLRTEITSASAFVPDEPAQAGEPRSNTGLTIGLIILAVAFFVLSAVIVFFFVVRL
jgi:hypothetical protein